MNWGQRIFIAAALGAAAWAQSGAETAGWTIEGVVKSGDAAAPGAVVRISGPSIVRGARTDAAGRYRLAGQFPGTYVLTVLKDGTGGAKPKSVVVAAGTHAQGIDFALRDEAVLAGTVIDASKRPLSGVNVMAWARTSKDGAPAFVTKGFTETDDRGAFRVEELGAGQYLLAAVLPPLKPVKRVQPAEGAESRGSLRYTFLPGTPEWAAGSPVSVNFGDKREGLSIAFRTVPVYCAAASIRVPAPPGAAPQASLTIIAPVAASFLQVARGPVTPGEPWWVCGLPAGEYKALAVAFDPQTKKTIGFGAAEFQIGRQNVDLGDLDAAAALSLEGTVRVDGAAREEALPEGLGIHLDLKHRSIYYGENRDARLEASGQFRLSGAFADDYGLQVTGLPPGYYVQAAQQDGRDAWRGPVRVGGGPLTVTLRKDGPVLQGRTVTKDDEPAGDTPVALVDAGSGRVYQTQSDAAGRFQFQSELPPGRYTVVAVSGLTAGEEEDPAVYRRLASSGTEVELGAGARVDRSFRVRAAR